MRQHTENKRSYVLKPIPLITLITGLFFLLAGQAFANNLLDNPNFENGVITGWTTTGFNWVASNTIKHEGVYAAQNTIGTIPGQDYFGSLSQVEPLSPGAIVYNTVWAKTDIDPRSSAVAGLKIEFLRSNGTTISSKQSVIGGLTDWRQLYVSATAPGETVNVRYSVFVFATQAETTPPGGIALGGLAYFDEAVLSTDPIAAPPNQTNLINAGFENGLNDWNAIYSPGLSVDNSIKFAGNYSVKETIATNLGFDFFSSAYQDIEYQGSGSVSASAYIKTAMNAASSARAGLLVEFYDRFNPTLPSHKLDEAKQEVSGNNDWMKLLINSASVPLNTIMVRVHVYTFALNGDVNANGALANFDEVVFSYQPLPPDPFRTSVLNSGFENGVNLWSELFGFPSSVSTTAHAGTYSAKKTVGQIEGQDYYSQIYQDIYYNSAGNPFPINTPVYASSYVKTVMNPVTKSKAGLQFEFIDAAGNVIEDGSNNPIIVNSSVGGNTDWRYLYITKQTPAGTAKVRVSGYEFARQQDASLAGDGYYDDFVFSLSALPLPPARTSLLNIGFENGLNDWDEFNKPGEVSTSIFHGGSKSAYFQMDLSAPIDGYYGSASQDLSIVPGKKVVASIWVKTDIDPSSVSAAGIKIDFLDQNGVQIGGSILSPLVGNQPTWTQIGVGGTAPAGANKVRFTCFLSGPPTYSTPGDIAYFDDAYLDIRTPAGSTGCFVKGTKIKLSDGRQVAIENIKTGDKVLGFEANQLQPAEVLHTFAHPKVNGYFIVRTQDGTQLNVTGVHPIFTGKDYQQVSDLKQGDTIYILKEEKLIKTTITSISLQEKQADVYDLEVANVHNYFANGCLVHNRKVIQEFSSAEDLSNSHR